jgi:AcrR family transcriptional regulator
MALDHRPGLRERKKSRLRQQILETAVALFEDKGYEGTRVSDITELLDISQPTFFRYFPSKDAILQEIVADSMQGLARKLREGRGLKVEERMCQAYGSYADFLKAHRNLARMACSTWSVPWMKRSELEVPSAGFPMPVADVIREAQDSGELTHKIPATELAEMFSGMLGVLLLKWCAEIGEPFDLTQRLNSAIGVFCSGARA